MKTIGLEEIQHKDRMSSWFIRFSEQTVGSDMYQFISKKIALDADLLALATTSDLGQPVPNLFLAAINFILYKEPFHPLARYYPNHSGNAWSEDGFFTEFKKFCLSQSEQITQIMESRLVQTNEVRRCALLLPALAEVAKATNSEIALVDVGTSTGLNLLLDSYFYQYSNGTYAGDRNSDLTIRCEVRGNPEATSFPRIGRRIGIDLNPIDLRNADEVLWTLSLVWPDQVERIERLKSAIKILNQKQVELLKGDANALLRQVADGIPKSLAFCVMHSFTLNQFSTSARGAFEEQLRDISLQRDVWRVSLEWLGTESPELRLDHYCSGELTERRTLATCHQHGEWIDWISSPDENSELNRPK